jgi:hypothetical protein
MNFPNANAHATISPSAISTDSQSGINDVMLDGASNMTQSSASMGQQSMMAPTPMNHDPYWDNLSQPTVPLESVLDTGRAGANLQPAQANGFPSGSSTAAMFANPSPRIQHLQAGRPQVPMQQAPGEVRPLSQGRGFGLGKLDFYLTGVASALEEKSPNVPHDQSDLLDRLYSPDMFPALPLYND